jgi:hypothetical protein
MEFFKQPLLRQAQLAYGLTWRTDQPEPTEAELVPWEPIVVLAAEPDDLHARRGIAFQETEDQLDDLKLAVLDLASGRRIALIRHSRNPAPGTEVHVLPRQFTSATDLSGVMAAIDCHQDALVTETLSALGIDAQEVFWRRPIGAWLQQHDAEASAESPRRRCDK